MGKLKVRLVSLFLVISSICSAQSFLDANSLLSNKYQGKFIGGKNLSKTVYPSNKLKKSVYVENKAQFLDALKAGDRYQVIYIDGKAAIDLSDQKIIYIKTGTKIISNRGVNGSLGAKLFSNNSQVFPLFECGSNVTFFGVRVLGGDSDVYYKGKRSKNGSAANTYGGPVTQGIRSIYGNLLVENCELSGWSHSAVVVKGDNAKIIYSYIHHNRRNGLGYGVVVDGGTAMITANMFDYNRHNIASTGIKGSSYSALYNIFLSHGTSHAVDVHGGKDRNDNTNLAGSKFEIRNNIFVLPVNQPAFVIRGVPSEEANFSDNTIIVGGEGTSNNVKARKKIINLSNVVIQKNAKGNLTTKNNNIQ